MVVLAILSIMALFLFIGASVYDRLYVMPWIWTKYSIVFIQIIRFIAIIIQLSSSVKNTTGASPIFELLLLGEFLNDVMKRALKAFDFCGRAFQILKGL